MKSVFSPSTLWALYYAIKAPFSTLPVLVLLAEHFTNTQTFTKYSTVWSLSVIQCFRENICQKFQLELFVTETWPYGDRGNDEVNFMYRSDRVYYSCSILQECCYALVRLWLNSYVTLTTCYHSINLLSYGTFLATKISSWIISNRKSIIR